ncbi:uncharacterized protein [Parasteatoda tepidariorum]|uniref:uncharacterized protein n=1 Tax=Parasteatoda tepidariorum TaxID=114398 RepID=UPI001C720FCD|nr:uncharacterized protein LOC122268909 [Parasteatoda tepidariorum]
MDEAVMKLMKGKSNSPKLEKLWENSESEFNPREIQNHYETILIKVMGYIWHRYKDNFKFEVTNLIQFIKNSDKTKITLIRSSGRIFDPIGFSSPFTMRLKTLFQELWEKRIHWDEELPVDIAHQWDTWFEELPLVNSLKISSYYFDSTLIEDMKSIQIHCFTDSSEIAYGAVIYLGFTDTNNDISVKFLLSKGRLAPLKKLTIPRLELSAALIGARLISHIKPVFQNIHGFVFKVEANLANRVREIQSLTDSGIWHHFPGQTNPADIITRSRKLSELITSDLWWSGPEWLHREENWPHAPYIVSDSDNFTLDLDTLKSYVSLLIFAEENLVDLKLFRTLNKTIRVTAWIKRFVHNLKMKTKSTEFLNSSEMSEAETFWITRVQESALKLVVGKYTCGR